MKDFSTDFLHSSTVSTFRTCAYRTVVSYTALHMHRQLLLLLK